MKAILLPTLQGVSFQGPKSQLKSICEAKKLILAQKSILIIVFLTENDFDGFKSIEAKQNKIRKTIFNVPDDK